MIVRKNDISEVVKAEAATLTNYRVSPLGWVPVVTVGQISKTGYSVGVNYQPAGVKVGDTFVPPHAEDFLDGVLTVVAVKE